MHLLWRAGLFAAAAYGSWHALGPFGLVITAPLAGLLFARPVMELFIDTQAKARELALRDVQGRYFQHRGHSVDVAEDGDGQRWLLTSDVRKVVPGLPRDDVLQRLYAGRAGQLPDFHGVRIRADALLHDLRKATEPATIRFKVWIERDVVGRGRG
jgi:hypothetical protein